MVEQITIRDLRRKQFFMVDDEYLNGYARLCGINATGTYLSLCRHSNKEQQCFPSKRLIAEELNISERSVYRSLNILEKWNIIKKENQGRKINGLFKNTLYTLLDKRYWNNKPSAIQSDHLTSNGLPHSQYPSANDDINGLPQVPNKETHIKETHLNLTPCPQRGNRGETEPISSGGITLSKEREARIDLLISKFEVVNSFWKSLLLKKPQRKASAEILDKFGLEESVRLINELPDKMRLPFFSSKLSITKPSEFVKNIDKLNFFVEQNEKKIRNGGGFFTNAK